MRVHPRGLIVFGVFVIALALASRSPYVSLAALGAVFIEACVLRGIVFPGYGRSDRASR
jgi:hypothetical protein